MDVNPHVHKSASPAHDSAQVQLPAGLVREIIPDTRLPPPFFRVRYRGWKSVFASLLVRECPCMKDSPFQSSR